MKKFKRTLRLLLCLIMVAGLVPTTVFAEESEPTKYDVWVAGTQVTSANAADVLGDGAASYNPTTNTLTVSKNITATGYDVIQASTENNFNVVIADGVILTSADDDGIYYYGDGVLTVTGNNIDISASGYTIYGSQDVIIDCDKFDTIGSYGVYAYDGSAKLTVDGDVTIDAGVYGIYGYEDITIDCADLTITSDEYAGIYAGDGSVDLTAGNVTISAVNGSGIAAYGSAKLTVDGDVTIDAGVYGIYGYEDVTIDCADLTITGVNYGIYANYGSVSLKAGGVTIDAVYDAIYVYEDVTIDCADLTITIDEYYGIYASRGSVDLTAGNVTISAVNGSGIGAYGSVNLTAGDVTIDAVYDAIYGYEDATIDCDTLNIISGLYGIYVYDGSIIIKNGTFDIQSTDASEYEADYYALHFTDGVQFPTGATVIAATQPNGDFEEYDKDKNATYDHVKIGAATPTTYTVTFDSDGGSAVTAQNVESGKTATKPADPTKEGYTFKGWYLDGSEYDFSTPVTGAITLKAKWEAVVVAPTTYTVTFDSDGGSAVTAQTVESGKTATKPADPTKEGYTFNGWTLAGSAYDFNSAVNSDITLVASWEQQQVVPTTYTVSFAANGGTGTMADVTGVSGEYELPACTFTAPSGQQFKAWSVSGVEKAVGNKINVTADTTVTAVWEDIPAGHTCDIKPVAKVEPSCAEGGKEAYYKCEGCGKFFEDALGAKEITDLAAWGNIPKNGHTESDWKSDKDNHWKECTVTACGVIIENSKAAHKDDNKDGKCDVCEYNVGVLGGSSEDDKPSDIPQTGSDVPQTGSGVPHTGDTSTLSVWAALLFVSGLVLAVTVLGKKRNSAK